MDTSCTPPAAPGRWPGKLVGAAALISFLLLVHSLGLPLLPARALEISPDRFRPAGGHAYAFNYDGSAADEPLNRWSRLQLCEDGRPFPIRVTDESVVRRVGGDYWAYAAGRVVFAPRDDADPRRSGRHYTLRAPPLYQPWIGKLSLLVFLLAVGGLYRLRAGAAAPAAGPAQAMAGGNWQLLGAGLLFAAGLYCNTGSLSPYAVTGAVRVNPTTGYLFNTDYPHFRVLFDFVDGRDRSLWQGAIMLRRILYPVLAWPFMKAVGFEAGGMLAGIVLNLAGFACAVLWLRRRIGERGAVFAGWMLAVYPGAAYWVGQPFVYSLIFPLSLLLLIGLETLSAVRGWRLAGVSLAMGLAYLGYDLAVFYLLASILVLVSLRRWGAAAGAAALQFAPTVLWTGVLRFLVRVPLENSNSTTYRVAVSAYTHWTAGSAWWTLVRESPRIAAAVFLGANFIFLPALFLGAVAFNPLTARIRLSRAEAALLLVGGALFAFLNLAPPYEAGWVMRGTWIARLYQPLFPALVFFAARWWAQLPRRKGGLPWLAAALALAAAAGGLAVIFGPILADPGGISQTAFYRFYDTSPVHGDYHSNLARFGRRPLGFTHPEPRPPTLEEVVAGIKADIAKVNRAIAANAAVLAQIRTDAAWPRVQRPPLPPPEAGIAVPPGPGLGEAEAALAAANDRLIAWQQAVLQAQADLGAARAKSSPAR